MKKPSKNPALFFTVDETYISAISETRQLLVEKLGPENDAMFTQLFAQSQAVREKGGVGVGLMLIIVPKASIMHITPFELSEPFDEAVVPVNSNWEADLKYMVEKGITF